MTPHTHEYEFSALPPSTIALRVRDVAAAKAKLEDAGLEVGDLWDSGLCKGAGVNDPSGNRVLLHRRYGPYPDGSMCSTTGLLRRAFATASTPPRWISRRRLTPSSGHVSSWQLGM